MESELAALIESLRTGGNRLRLRSAAAGGQPHRGRRGRHPAPHAVRARGAEPSTQPETEPREPAPSRGRRRRRSRRAGAGGGRADAPDEVPELRRRRPRSAERRRRSPGRGVRRRRGRAADRAQHGAQRHPARRDGAVPVRELPARRQRRAARRGLRQRRGLIWRRRGRDGGSRAAWRPALAPRAGRALVQPPFAARVEVGARPRPGRARARTAPSRCGPGSGRRGSAPRPARTGRWAPDASQITVADHEQRQRSRRSPGSSGGSAGRGAGGGRAPLTRRGRRQVAPQRIELTGRPGGVGGLQCAPRARRCSAGRRPCARCSSAISCSRSASEARSARHVRALTRLESSLIARNCRGSAASRATGTSVRLH